MPESFLMLLEQGFPAGEIEYDRVDAETLFHYSDWFWEFFASEQGRVYLQFFYNLKPQELKILELARQKGLSGFHFYFPQATVLNQLGKTKAFSALEQGRLKTGLFVQLSCDPEGIKLLKSIPSWSTEILENALESIARINTKYQLL